jgi:hypothetical protein
MNGYKASTSQSAFLCARILLTLCLVSLIHSMAVAGLIVIPPPPSVQPGAIQSQTDATMFQESVTTLASPLSVDIAAPGLYTNATPNAPGVIPANTAVASYMIHHESVANVFSSVLVSITFPQPILGVIISDALLNASDPILGNPTTSYPTGLTNRGLELPFPVTPDAIFWSGNQVFFQVETNTAAVLDQLRVLTSVPEPTTIVLGLLAACGALALRKRKHERVA